MSEESKPKRPAALRDDLLTPELAKTEVAPWADAATRWALSSLRTTEGRRIGTPRCMAPEQHAGDPTDPRTDQYAWGLVAFELLARSSQ